MCKNNDSRFNFVRNMCSWDVYLKGLMGKDGKVADSGKHREIVEYSEERKVLSYLAWYHFTQFNISTCECAIPCM